MNQQDPRRGAPLGPARPGAEFQQDALVDKPGIVGARWWHQALIDQDARVSRRQALVGLGTVLGATAALAALGAGLASLAGGDAVSLAERDALAMQKTYGWDFGARGVPLVFDGVVQAPFVRGDLEKLGAVMAPAQPFCAKYHVPTLVESLVATPTATLPDPQDGQPRPDAAPFKRLVDVIVPIATPAMQQAYAAGEALASLARGRARLAVLADLPGPEAVAFAAGAAEVCEPVLLFDNWPHPHGVVPSHLALAALAYYQPRFASHKQRIGAPPLFVLDRARLAPYTDDSARFDNRYYARMPTFSALSKDGVKELVYVVAASTALPEPDDLNAIFAAKPDAGVRVRAVALTDFRRDGSADPRLYYGGSAQSEDGFWMRQPDFVPAPRSVSMPALARVPVMVAASGLILAAALDRRGSMNRFSGGWSG